MAQHTAYDLKQMQSLPLEAKIRMTKQRIKAWYESWVRYEIINSKTGKTRYVTATEEPPLKENEYINSEIDGQVYVSVSGIDSSVLKHLVDSMYSDVPSVFVNTGLEYPEIQRFWQDSKSGKYDCFNSDVQILRPKMRFDEVLREYGYPVISKEVSQKIYDYRRNPEGWTKERFDENSEYVKRYGKSYCLSKWIGLRENHEIPVSHMCCIVFKKTPLKEFEKKSGLKPMLGTMAEESRNRRTAWMKNGCNAFVSSRPTSQPLSFWTKQDILQYVQQYNVPYPSVYGDIIEVDGKLKTTGCDRTGCIFCMFGCHLEKAPNRFQRLKETHPRQYEYCIGGGEMVDGKWQPNKEGLGLGKVLDYIGVDYE